MILKVILEPKGHDRDMELVDDPRAFNDLMLLQELGLIDQDGSQRLPVFVHVLLVKLLDIVKQVHVVFDDSRLAAEPDPGGNDPLA